VAEVDEVKVEVVGVFEQPAAGGGDEARLPLLILRDPADRELHLSLGSCEAFAVHLALARRLVPRPLTHDLALRLLQKLSVTVGRVVIGRHPRDGYQATMYLNVEEGEMVLPAQPGDAIAIALRAEAPIYVTEESLSGLGTQSG
jgi:bifunctional DNase/RNase